MEDHLAMDNNILAVSHSPILATPPKQLALSCEPATSGDGLNVHQHAFVSPAVTEETLDDATIPADVRMIIRELIHKYGFTREQYVAIFDEYERLSRLKRATTDPIEEQMERVDQGEETMNTDAVDVEEESHSLADGTGETDQQQLQGEVNRLQSVVQSAMETYDCSPILLTHAPAIRKTLSLPNEIITSPFARELIQRDQALVAQAIRKYLHQYSIPQREVVEKTGINQSHLSQHFTRGVPIKPAKRVKLYHWFEHDQLQRTGKLLSADGSLNAVLDSPKVEGYRRRPRWRWSPVATQILTEAFKKNRFPTREQRLELSRICNEAESAMNNGEPLQGPEGDTEGITEQRINTWFTNRRKGLVTPSPTREGVGLGLGTIPTASLAILPSPMSTGLSFATTPTDSSSQSTQTFSSSSALPPTTPTDPITLTTTPLTLSPINIQSLLNQLQVQSGPVTPILAQNLGQILVSQIPQGITLQSPQTISIETLARLSGGQVGAMPDEQPPTASGESGGMTVAGEEEIISNTIQTSTAKEVEEERVFGN